jgi:4-hydroxythreonine-4-phosphate dehydrogenase
VTEAPAPLALTAGEPAGIGPDLCVLIAQRRWQRPLICIADPTLLVERARQMNVPLQVRHFDPATPACAAEPGELVVLPVQRVASTLPGHLDSANSEYVLETLRSAVDGCTDGTFAAMVTAPVHKGVINDAGIAFSGHTEFLADRSGGYPVMMLACPGLRVALATTHLPLRSVPDAITAELLQQVIRIVDQDLRERFHIDQPRLLICGLNPHAGEGGYLGREEIEVIEPALASLLDEGIKLSGPLPADTVFTRRHLTQADAVVAMYHDQGLPVLKHMGFGAAVNITLGLPIIRTSVDHGTALDLAGSGKIDSGSLVAAIEQAIELTA